MAILIEASRIQVFPVQITPNELHRTTCKPETLITLDVWQLETMLDAITAELNLRKEKP